jgi:purine-nucleoside phosphorylase
MDPQVVRAIKKVLEERHISYSECMTWTTDGFFRETEDMVVYRREEGCAVVEMECAALAACAIKRGAQFGQLLFTADTLADASRYDPRNWGASSFERALALLFEITLEM